jgi:hypothetical protein
MLIEEGDSRYHARCVQAQGTAILGARQVEARSVNLRGKPHSIGSAQGDRPGRKSSRPDRHAKRQASQSRDRKR